MKMDQVAGSGNDEFYTPGYAVDPLLKYIPSAASCWCPFDTSESIIVKKLQYNSNFVVFSHIGTGCDFFNTRFDCEYVISNPPYSLKTSVFQRFFEMNVKFAMLVGVVGLFESKSRFEMFAKYNFEIMWMSKRVSYFKSYDDPKPSLNPPFSSVWVTRGVLPQGNVFERIHK